MNPWANHDGCMAAFDAAGIYTFIDLDTFNTTVSEATPMWTQTQFEAFAMVLDVFSGYDNVAGKDTLGSTTTRSLLTCAQASISVMRSSTQSAHQQRVLPTSRYDLL